MGRALFASPRRAMRLTLQRLINVMTLTSSWDRIEA